MKTERKDKAPCMKKINTDAPSRCCVHSTFAYGDVSDPLKMYRGKYCVEKFVEYIEEEVKRLYEIFSQQSMIKLTDVQKREHEAAEKCHIFKHTGRFWECHEKFRLMIRKGLYLYEYIDSWKKFEETSLSLKDVFCSRLNMKGISDQDYEHAQESLEYHGEKDPWLLSRYLPCNRCIAVSGRI